MTCVEYLIGPGTIRVQTDGHDLSRETLDAIAEIAQAAYRRIELQRWPVSADAATWREWNLVSAPLCPGCIDLDDEPEWDECRFCRCCSVVYNDCYLCRGAAPTCVGHCEYPDAPDNCQGARAGDDE
jgi:hypothetical protein